jgi:uncharacterized protein YndB with AHSA1/START domain
VSAVAKEIRYRLRPGVERADRLAPGSSTVEVTLTREADGTTVQVVHGGLPESEAKQHASGWQHFLARLEVAGTGRDPGPDPWAMGPFA